MVFGSHAKTRAMYSTPPCPSLAASTAAYRRRSFSDSHPKNRLIFPAISATYTSMPYSLLQNLLRSKDTTAPAIREVILDHILSGKIAMRQASPTGFRRVLGVLGSPRPKRLQRSKGQSSAYATAYR